MSGSVKDIQNTIECIFQLNFLGQCWFSGEKKIASFRCFEEEKKNDPQIGYSTKLQDDESVFLISATTKAAVLGGEESVEVEGIIELFHALQINNKNFKFTEKKTLKKDSIIVLQFTGNAKKERRKVKKK